MSSQIKNASNDQPTVSRTDDSSEPSEPEPPGLPLDQVFDVLRNERRRLVLSKLAETGESETIGELAEHVAAYENDKPVAQLSSDERKRAYVGLYQCHLPKMDARDIVEFNKNRGKVELGPNYPLVEPYLESDDGEDESLSWPRRYLALSLAAVVLLVLTTPGVALVTQLAAVGVVLAFAVTATVHWRQTRADSK